MRCLAGPVVASIISTQVISSLLLFVHRSQSLVGLGGLEEASLVDEVSGGVGDLVDDGLGHLLHPLRQLKLGDSSGIGVDQIGEKRAIFLIALVLNKNIFKVSSEQNH